MRIEGRFTAEAVRKLRGAIREARGNEILVAGRLDRQRRVATVIIGARGNAETVPALKPYLEQGDVVIHNHPSGLLEPSAADLQIASRLGDQGIGFYIVNNPVTELYAVAEPVSPRELVPLDPEELAAHLEPGGTLSRIYPAYERRSSQVDMLKYVCRAFNSGELCIAEAGTGVGKSLAYLIPAFAWVLANDERIVISTATINLQQQLVEKDIPLVARLVGRDPGCTLVKGRGNYLCRNRLEEAREESTLFEEQDQGFQAIYSWSLTTATGSRSELPFYPDEELWARVCSEADACRGLRCPYREDCFVLQARREAAASRLLVANHHLLFSDLSMRLSGLGFDSAAVLPPFQRIVFDEAHNIEKSATSYFSDHFSRFQVVKYAGRLYRERRGRRSGLLLGLEKTMGRSDQIGEIRKAIAALADQAGLLDAAALELPGAQGTFRLAPREPDPRLPALLLEPLRALASTIDLLHSRFEALFSACSEQEQESYLVFESKLELRRLMKVAEICHKFLRFEQDREQIYWLESRKSFRGEPYVNFLVTPLDVAPVMNRAVYEPYQTVVFTSATLTVDNRFDYWKNRLGFHLSRDRGCVEAVFPSPFDYLGRVFLGIPGEAPEPDREEFSGFVEDFVREALLISEGHALVLFTSYSLLDKIYAGLRPALGERGIPVMRQGEDDRHRLLARFLDNPASVLLATDSFWEGVDAPGRALEVVILTRLPFRVPTDPVLAARTEAVEERGGNAFQELALPDAIIRLRQGFGRLMRRQDDSGAVLILDPRIVRKRYGRYFLSSLPATRTLVSSNRGVLDGFEDFLVSMRQKEEHI